MTESEAMAMATEYLTDNPEERIRVMQCPDGHEGPGWYGWVEDYPDEGSVFLGPVSP